MIRSRPAGADRVSAYAERALRGIAVGRRNWTFCGSDAGGQRAAVFYTLIETCRMNDVDPRAWLADIFARIADHPAKRITELLPWNWKAARLTAHPEAVLLRERPYRMAPQPRLTAQRAQRTPAVAGSFFASFFSDAT